MGHRARNRSSLRLLLMTLLVFFISVWEILINELENISFMTYCNCCRLNLLLGLNFISLFLAYGIV